MLRRATLLITALLMLSSCEQMALMVTPSKKPTSSHSKLADSAKKNFWDTLHKGNYAALPQTTSQLTDAYLEDSNDPQLAGYLGFAHIWRITERAREKNIPATITNEIILAKKYFSDAVELSPEDARLQGFLGVSMLASGKIFNNEREQVQGYFQLKHAIGMWPEFNYFTAGYPMSDLAFQSEHFSEGVAWQWKTLDLCAGATINRNHPDYSPYMALETQKGPKRACWNSWIAPHNFEGFFLNMGDMLVKQGDWQTAIKIYNNAKLSKTYATWPYRHLLERRIQHAEENVTYFQKNTGRSADTRVLFNSGRGCVACHQK